MASGLTDTQVDTLTHLAQRLERFPATECISETPSSTHRRDLSVWALATNLRYFVNVRHGARPDAGAVEQMIAIAERALEQLHQRVALAAERTAAQCAAYEVEDLRYAAGVDDAPVSGDMLAVLLRGTEESFFARRSLARAMGANA